MSYQGILQGYIKSELLEDGFYFLFKNSFVELEYANDESEFLDWEGVKTYNVEKRVIYKVSNKSSNFYDLHNLSRLQGSKVEYFSHLDIDKSEICVLQFTYNDITHILDFTLSSVFPFKTNDINFPVNYEFLDMSSALRKAYDIVVHDYKENSIALSGILGPLIDGIYIENCFMECELTPALLEGENSNKINPFTKEKYYDYKRSFFGDVLVYAVYTIKINGLSDVEFKNLRLLNGLEKIFKPHSDRNIYFYGRLVIDPNYFKSNYNHDMLEFKVINESGYWIIDDLITIEAPGLSDVVGNFISRLGSDVVGTDVTIRDFISSNQLSVTVNDIISIDKKIQGHLVITDSVNLPELVVADSVEIQVLNIEDYTVSIDITENVIVEELVITDSLLFTEAIVKTEIGYDQVIVENIDIEEKILGEIIYEG